MHIQQKPLTSESMHICSNFEARQRSDMLFVRDLAHLVEVLPHYQKVNADYPPILMFQTPVKVALG